LGPGLLLLLHCLKSLLHYLLIILILLLTVSPLLLNLLLNIRGQVAWDWRLTPDTAVSGFNYRRFSRRSRVAASRDD
jgi:hypothetical protein